MPPVVPGRFSLLRHRPLLMFVSARAAATIAYQMMGVAVGWQIYASDPPGT